VSAFSVRSDFFSIELAPGNPAMLAQLFLYKGARTMPKQLNPNQQTLC
jgi:hypothetical protein